MVIHEIQLGLQYRYHHMARKHGIILPRWHWNRPRLGIAASRLSQITKALADLDGVLIGRPSQYRYWQRSRAESQQNIDFGKVRIRAIQV